jgi:hypothetical protein
MSLYSETALDAQNVVEFIGKAVQFANKKLWGTFSATIVVHPASMNNPQVAAAVDQAIADLHYGSIVINFHARQRNPTWVAWVSKRRLLKWSPKSVLTRNMAVSANERRW